MSKRQADPPPNYWISELLPGQYQAGTYGWAGKTRTSRMDAILDAREHAKKETWTRTL